MSQQKTRAATHAWWVTSRPELNDLCPLQLILGQGRLVADSPQPTKYQAEMLAEPWNKRYARMLDSLCMPEHEMAEPVASQDARAAIDGAIAFGRMGINTPPDGHWLTEYWSIGQQLAELGKTSAWDNQTPVATHPAADRLCSGRDWWEHALPNSELARPSDAIPPSAPSPTVAGLDENSLIEIGRTHDIHPDSALPFAREVLARFAAAPSGSAETRPDTFERARAIVETWPGWKREFTLTPYSAAPAATRAEGAVAKWEGRYTSTSPWVELNEHEVDSVKAAGWEVRALYTRSAAESDKRAVLTDFDERINAAIEAVEDQDNHAALAILRTMLAQHQTRQQDDRAAFEVIAKEQCLPLSRVGITYDDISTQAAWAVYRKARAAMSCEQSGGDRG